MTKQEVIEVLTQHNLWRRGEDEEKMTDPTLLGIAMDEAIKLLKEINCSSEAAGFSANRISTFNAMKFGLKAGSVSIQDVNDFCNTSIKYKRDDARDHWQTPLETLTLGHGDCEDIAILKFFMLINTHDAYLCYCSVLIDGAHEGHMTCLVVEPRLKFFSREVNLDSQSRPIVGKYSFNKIKAFRKIGKEPSGDALKINKWADLMMREKRDSY